jgi:hypothetical protein
MVCRCKFERRVVSGIRSLKCLRSSLDDTTRQKSVITGNYVFEPLYVHYRKYGHYVQEGAQINRNELYGLLY